MFKILLSSSKQAIGDFPCTHSLWYEYWITFTLNEEKMTNCLRKQVAGLSFLSKLKGLRRREEEEEEVRSRWDEQVMLLGSRDPRAGRVSYCLLHLWGRTRGLPVGRTPWPAMAFLSLWEKCSLLMWLTSCCHILCQPLLSSTKYIVVDLAFMVESQSAKSLSLPLLCGNLNKLLLSSQSMA